jgi:hypothetical protein
VYLRRSVSASVADEKEMSSSKAAINKTGILFTTDSWGLMNVRGDKKIHHTDAENKERAQS